MELYFAHKGGGICSRLTGKRYGGKAPFLCLSLLLPYFGASFNWMWKGESGHC